MFGAIKHGLFNLANFNGRDARSTFWFYLLFIFILRFVAGMAISVPMTLRASAVAMEAVNKNLDVGTMQALMMRTMAEAMPMVMWLGIGVTIVTALMLVASLVRRLHDFGMSGWWVLLPAAIQAYVLAQSPAALQRALDMIAHIDPKVPFNPAAMSQAQGPAALIGWLPALFVIVIGLIKSNDGLNRFGDAPVRD